MQRQAEAGRQNMAHHTNCQQAQKMHKLRGFRFLIAARMGQSIWGDPQSPAVASVCHQLQENSVGSSSPIVCSLLVLLDLVLLDSGESSWAKEEGDFQVLY